MILQINTSWTNNFGSNFITFTNKSSELLIITAKSDEFQFYINIYQITR